MWNDSDYVGQNDWVFQNIKKLKRLSTQTVNNLFTYRYQKALWETGRYRNYEKKNSLIPLLGTIPYTETLGLQTQSHSFTHQNDMKIFINTATNAVTYIKIWETLKHTAKVRMHVTMKLIHI
jgi:hypothetical protein